MRVVQAARRAWVDTPARVTPSIAAALVRYGYAGVIRYVPRWRVSDPTKPLLGWLHVLSAPEVADILEAGLQLSVVQACKTTGSGLLSAARGVELAQVAVGHCRQIGLPRGITIWYDAEWSDGPSAASVLAELNAWCDYVARADRAGIYAGYHGLSGGQLYSVRSCYHYWGSAMSVQSPQPAGLERWIGHRPRGWQMRQGMEIRLQIDGVSGGLDVDQDLACYDDRGERFYCLAK